MSDTPARKAITMGFNVLLFLYLIYASFVSYLFDPESESHVPMDDFFEIAPVASIVTAVVLVLCFFSRGHSSSEHSGTDY